MKNGCVAIGNTDMYYVSFGHGDRNLVVLPGLSDGLATVKGKALFLKAPYKRFLNEFFPRMTTRKKRIEPFRLLIVPFSILPSLIRKMR